LRNVIIISKFLVKHEFKLMGFWPWDISFNPLSTKTGESKRDSFY